MEEAFLLFLVMLELLLDTDDDAVEGDNI